MTRKRIFTENLGASLTFDMNATDLIYEFGRFTPQEDIIVVAFHIEAKVMQLSQNDHWQHGWLALTTQYGGPTEDGVLGRVNTGAEWNTSPGAIVREPSHMEMVYPEDVGFSVREAEVIYLIGSFRTVTVGEDVIGGSAGIQYIRGRAIN